MAPSPLAGVDLDPGPPTGAAILTRCRGTGQEYADQMEGGEEICRLVEVRR